jgi:hypothetical protein
MIGLGMFIILSDKIVQGKAMLPLNGGIFVRPDIYIRLLGGIIIFLAILMLIKSINFSKVAETKGFKIIVSRAGLLTMGALIAYTLVLTSAGFFISTFALSMFLVCLYMYEEQGGVKITRSQIFKKILIALLFSIILVAVVYLLFSKVLYVSLP